MAEDYGYGQGYGDDMLYKIRDLEEKGRIMNERILLVGKNVIAMREEYEKTIQDLKKELYLITTHMQRLITFIETASAEFPKYAKKEDVEILARQAKMFQPFLEKREK